MQHDDPQHSNRPQWRQINIQFDGHDASEHNAIDHLGPALMTAESTGLLASWFFIRKQWWRFRYMPTSSTAACDGALNSPPHGQSKRRELSVLLGAALMRAAGQGRYEQGDIWAKVADQMRTALRTCFHTSCTGQAWRRPMRWDATLAGRPPG